MVCDEWCVMGDVKGVLCDDAACGSSYWRLCVLSLPHKEEPRASCANARKSSLLRLPHKEKPRASGDHARSISFRRLWALRLPRKKGAAGQRRARAQQLLQDGGPRYCTCHTRAASCTCHLRAASSAGGSV